MQDPSQDKPKHPHLSKASLRSLLHVTMAFALGAAAVGYLVGIRAGVPTETGRVAIHSAAPPHDSQAPAAPSYTQMRDADLGPNADWHNRLSPRDTNQAALFAELPDDPAARAAAVQKRADLRAYDGAPPVVPHSIDQNNATACLACHEQGLTVGDVVAPRMSHHLLTNCTQCHVEAANTHMTSPGPAWGDNAFIGKESVGQGQRAWQGAPPTIPHTTWMRQNCASCHGTLNEIGLRTSHPWRTNCTQCHAPSAELDQRITLDALRPPVVDISQEGSP